MTTAPGAYEHNISNRNKTYCQEMKTCSSAASAQRGSSDGRYVAFAQSDPGCRHLAVAVEVAADAP
jgi:hypothetical protein